MEFFEAIESYNNDRIFEDESIHYQCESFDFELFESRQIVQVSLGEKLYECLVSSIEIPFDSGLTDVIFAPITRLK